MAGRDSAQHALASRDRDVARLAPAGPLGWILTERGCREEDGGSGEFD